MSNLRPVHKGDPPLRSHASIPLSNRFTPLQSTDHTSVERVKVLHSDSIREEKSKTVTVESKITDKGSKNTNNSGKKICASPTSTAFVGSFKI